MKHSIEHRKLPNRSKGSKDGEVVKYMTDLPAYLHRMEKGEKHQEKALNFGVLEWERLEKWKSRQQMHLASKYAMNNANPFSRSPNAQKKFPGAVMSYEHCSSVIMIGKEKRMTNSETETSKIDAKERVTSCNGESGMKKMDQNIVLLLPKDLPPKSPNVEKQNMMNKNSEPCSDLSHSCPLNLHTKGKVLNPSFIESPNRGPGGMSRSFSENECESQRPKSHDPSRGRSSPLRRLLDPLLKPKAISQTHQPLERKSDPSKFSKPADGMIHALLQFTLKNGLPLFKFVVDDDGSDILATTVKKSADDSSYVYTLYSVREMQKKRSSGWMNQGSGGAKGKNCGYAYSVVGEMTVSSSKEIILFESKSEVVAIVTDEENRCTVIISDGVHGLPNEGAPSPLIERWKSGGSCDCGGWDIGCKLKILTSCDRVCGIRTDHFDLFTEGGKRAVFSLTRMKSGIYSVKFNALMSQLHAFSICAGIMNSETSFDAVQRTRTQSDLRYFLDPPVSPIGRV